MKAGVNAGLSNEGMMKQEVYKRKIFDKFVQTVRIDVPAYHQFMKETFPDQVPSKCEGVFFTQDKFIEMVLCVWGGAQAKPHTFLTVADVWTSSRKIIERDAVTVFNTIMSDFKEGFPSGKDAEWTLTALGQLWYENDCLGIKKKRKGD
jgi:hypothetical protein